MPRRFVFAEFEVDARTRELKRDGSRVRVPDQSVQVLLELLERAGDVVTREELRDRLWAADTFVDFEHGLNSAVRRLRHALGDSADRPAFIETLPRRGYRFIAPVRRDPSETPATAASPSPADPPAPNALAVARQNPWSGRMRAVFGLAAVLAAVGIIAALWFGSSADGASRD